MHPEDNKCNRLEFKRFDKTQEYTILIVVGKKTQARRAILPSASVCVMKMITVSGYLSGKCPAKPLLQEDLNRHGVKEKHQPLCQKLVLLMWNDSKTNTIPGYRFAISLSFCNECNWVQNGCCRVQIRLGGCNIELSFCYLLFRPRLPCVGL